MPVPEATMYSMKRMNAIFAVSVAIMLITSLWFAQVDHQKVWREYQNQFATAQSILAHLDYVRTQSSSQKEKMENLRKAVEAAQREVDRRSDEIHRLKEESAQLKAEFPKIKIAYSSVDSILNVTNQHYEELLASHGLDDPRTQEVAKHREELVAQHVELRLSRDNNQDAQKKITDDLKKIMAPLTTTQKALATEERVVEAAKEREKQFGSPLRRVIFNFPMLDFAAPKNTAGHNEIRQVVLGDVVQQLNYLESYRTDRCMTCHVGIDNKEYTQKALVSRMESTFPAINERLASRGRPPLDYPEAPKPTAEYADAKIMSGDAARQWDKLPRDQRNAYFNGLLERINVYLESEGFARLEIGPVLFAHPDLDLFVNIDSPHPMKTMGCTVCHEGNSEETEFILASHTPADHKVEEAWRENYYDRVLGTIPTATFSLVEHYWDHPMLPTKLTEGNCIKCHHNPFSINDFHGEMEGTLVKKGYDLFTRSGCINCHLMAGMDDYPKVGPDLQHIAEKLEPGFAQQWIYNPRAFRPSTWMPHFFMQENNGPGSENDFDPSPMLRTQVEVAAITTYLFQCSQPWAGRQTLPEGLSGDAAAGRELFTKVGCLACHANLTEYGEEWIIENMQQEGGKTPAQAKADFDALTQNQRALYAMEHLHSDRETLFDPKAVEFDPARPYNKPVFTRVAPELSGIGTKTTVEWLYGWLREPSSYHAATRMPSLRLTPKEAIDLATYLATLKHDDPKVTQAFPEDEAFKKHAYDEAFGILAGQRSDARSKAMLDDENGELARALTSLFEKSPIRGPMADRIQSMDLETKRMFFLGSKAISHYGCFACHNIPGFETAVRPGTELTLWAVKPISQLDFGFFDPAFAAMREEEANHARYENLYPPTRPDLVGLHHGYNPETEMDHSHASFVSYKVRNPRIWDRDKRKKPFDKLKMPNFYFTEDEAEALTAYMLGRRPQGVSDNLIPNYADDPRDGIGRGRELVRRFNCIGCHQIENNAALVQQYFRISEGGRLRFDEVNAPPALRGEGAKIQSSWFYGFLNNVEMLRPWLNIRMPSFHLTPAEASDIVEYFAGLTVQDKAQLDKLFAPVEEYLTAELLAAHGANTGMGEAAGADGAGPKPGADWFKQEKLARSVEELARMVIERRILRSFQLDPDQNSPEELAANYDQVLQTSDFLRDLYTTSYPFADAPRPPITQERFALGEELVLDLQCLRCHVLGDPNREGSNPNPSAPNLNLTYRRLQQNWTYHWPINPAAIQPGTKMPAFWPGKRSAFADYGESAAEYEAKYGKTAEEQLALLLDYLYHAGQINHTAIDPNLPPPAPAAGEGGEEFTEDEVFEEGGGGDDFDN